MPEPDLSTMSLDQLAERERTMKARVDVMKGLHEDTRAAIVERMTALGTDQVTTSRGYRVVVVRGQSRSLDTEIAKQILQPRGLWDRAVIVTERVSEEAITAMLDQGELDEEALAPALQVTDIRPYPKVTKPTTGRKTR